MVPFKRSGVPLLAVIGLDAQRVSIYDSAGRLVTTLVDGVRAAGSHTANWDGTDAAGRDFDYSSYAGFRVARTLP
jgi:flagellar hook assembly protein FlgD